MELIAANSHRAAYLVAPGYRTLLDATDYDDLDGCPLPPERAVPRRCYCPEMIFYFHKK